MSRFALLLGLLPAIAASQPGCLIPDVDPGLATASVTPNQIILSNDCLNLTIDYSKEALQKGELKNLWPNSDGTLKVGMFWFAAVPAQGSSFPSYVLTSRPAARAFTSSGNTPRASDHIRGKEIDADFKDSGDGEMRVHWRLILLDGSNYVREECTFSPKSRPYSVSRFSMVQGSLPDAKVAGTAKGSPISNGSYFCATEHPRAESSVNGEQIASWVPHIVPINPGSPVTVSAVFGVSPQGQIRRAILNYVERERAHPYRTFLHYNSWLDIAYGKPYTAAESVDALQAFGQELVEKRHVKMDSSLFDDGWDDTNTVWEFHKGFPDGFTPLKETAAKYGFAPGVWLSPWGGYADARNQRLATGKREGMEIDREGYALSGPKYFERFRQVCLDFVKKYGVNQFKFDGTGSPDKHYPGSKFDSDFDAAIQLIHDLRAAKPDIFINLTTGTWPSPFWLKFADSTWRGGDDSAYAGVGTFRQKWITYRDGDTYHGVVEKGPLYPLNSLMLHGIIYGKAADELASDPGNDFRDEVRSYFGTGTQLQELYITHSLLTQQNWDDLAAGAKWARENEDELVDTHWVGGDPLKLEVYGWGAWCPRKASLVLRNPSDKPQNFSFDLGKVLELPDGKTYHSKDAYDGSDPIDWTTGQSQTVHLKPFEVRVLDLLPA
jgi:hypothetical protein